MEIGLHDECGGVDSTEMDSQIHDLPLDTRVSWSSLLVDLLAETRHRAVCGGATFTRSKHVFCDQCLPGSLHVFCCCSY